MTGGRRDYSEDSKPLSDIWMFNPQSRRWKEVSSLNKINNQEEHNYYYHLKFVVLQEIVNDHDHAEMTRWGHTVTVIMHTDSLVEVLMFGGSSDPYNKHKLDDISRLVQPVSLIYGYGENYDTCTIKLI